MCTGSLTGSGPAKGQRRCRRRDLIGWWLAAFVISAGLLSGQGWGDESRLRYRRNSNNLTDKTVEERQISNKKGGQDPFSFDTAKKMSMVKPVQPFDASARTLIKDIDYLLSDISENQDQEKLPGLMLRLEPYRKTDAVQQAVQKWVPRYLEGLARTLKNISFDKKKKIQQTATALFRQGNECYRNGDFTAATVKYRRVLMDMPRHADARNNLALAQMHLGNDLTAQFELESLRRIKPDYPPAQINLTVVLERLGFYQSAQALALAAYQTRKELPAAAFNAGWYYSLAGDYQKAVDILKPLHEWELNPKYKAFYDTNASLLKQHDKSRKPSEFNAIPPEKQALPVRKAPQKPDAGGKKPVRVSDQALSAQKWVARAREYHLSSERRDYGRAMTLYRQAADEGNAAAMSGIGSLYEHGHGVARDYGKAFDWYRQAAEKGHAAAMYNLGVMYAHGKGVERNMPRAIEWYRRCADLGDADAMNNLGVIYEAGQGIAQSLGGAAKWYRQAAGKGHAEAMANLGRLYESGRGLLQDRQQARSWYEKAAARGSGNAMNSLGLLSEENRDDAAAVGWYRKAADLNHAGAMGNLGYCYEVGRGVDRNMDEALRYYRKAADLGSRFASQALERLQ